MRTLSHSLVSFRPSRARYVVLVFACTLALLSYLDRICIMQARGSIQTDLGWHDQDMGLIFDAFILGYLLWEIPGGWMGDRWGARRVVTGIVLVWSLFTALTGCVWPFVLDSGLHLHLGNFNVPLLVNSLGVMLLIRFLFGLSEAGTFPNLTRIIRDWFPSDERASALGWIWTCARLGGALAPVALSTLTVHLGWRQAFWLFGLVGVAWSVVFYLRFRNRPEEDPYCNDAERMLIRHASTLSCPSNPDSEKEGERDGHAWPSWRVLAGSSTVWAICAASFFINFGWWFYATWQPKYWHEVHDIPDTDSGWLTGATFLCGAVGNLLGGRWSDRMLRRQGSRRWGRSVVGLIGYLLAAVCMLATGFTHTVWQAEALLCIGFLFNDLSVPVIWAVCTDVGGRCAGTLSGLVNMVGGLGAILSPVLLPHAYELLHQHFDQHICWRIIFAGLAASWFLGAFTWLAIDASKPLSE